jgi:hypothetical protein
LSEVNCRALNISLLHSNNKTARGRGEGRARRGGWRGGGRWRVIRAEFWNLLNISRKTSLVHAKTNIYDKRLSRRSKARRMAFKFSQTKLTPLLAVLLTRHASSCIRQGDYARALCILCIFLLKQRRARRVLTNNQRILLGR